MRLSLHRHQFVLPRRRCFSRPGRNSLAVWREGQAPKPSPIELGRAPEVPRRQVTQDDLSPAVAWAADRAGESQRLAIGREAQTDLRTAAPIALSTIRRESLFPSGGL